MVNSSVEAKERIRRIEKEERREIPRCEENKQLIKGTGLETQKTSSSSFFFAILLRNLWVICCREKTFCLPPLKKQA